MALQTSDATSEELRKAMIDDDELDARQSRLERQLAEEEARGERLAKAAAELQSPELKNLRKVEIDNLEQRLQTLIKERNSRTQSDADKVLQAQQDNDALRQQLEDDIKQYEFSSKSLIFRFYG